ncbi:MAG: hypothetical protein ACPGN3_13720 [Opitutales bacterium]
MSVLKAPTFCVLFILLHSLLSAWNSSRVFPRSDGRLVYVSDKSGNRIVDFSHAGYRGGGIDFPSVPVVKTIDPIEGDNTAHIQDTINEVAAMPVDEDGYRGTLLLNSGDYPVSGILYIRADGIVLRGKGQGTGSAASRIIGTGTNKRKNLGIIVIEPETNPNPEESGTRQNIVSPYIPVGCRTIEVEDASIYSVGDYLVIEHLATDAWLNAINYGNIDGDPNQWLPGDNALNMFFHGNITAIDGNQIKLDSPIYHEIDRDLVQATVYRHNGRGLIREVGVENIRVEIENQGGTDENHAWDCVHFIDARNCWAVDVTSKGFAESGIRFTRSTRSTALDCSAIGPVSQVTGGRRYNFYVGVDCHDILIKGGRTTYGRHCYVANGGATTNGIVFTQSTAERSHGSSENHRRWGAAMLWDNMVFENPITNVPLALYNRGAYGTSHGWTGTGLVAWNVSTPDDYVVCETPPLGENYAIGCNADIGRYSYPYGFVEGTRETPNIQSLYEAQLADRLTFGVGPDAPARLKASHYRSGEAPFVALDWLDTAMDETGFVIERSDDGGNSFTIIQTLPANTVGYTDTSVTADARYTYRVRSRNDQNRSAYSNPVDVNLAVVERRYLWTYQAEYYTSRANTPVKWDNHRWTGMGYAQLNQENSWFEFNNIEGGQGGNCHIVIHYASPDNRTGELIINGETITALDFQDTGWWNDWKSITINTKLNTGLNTLRIANTTAGEGARIDRIEIKLNPAIYAAGDYAPDNTANMAFDSNTETDWIHYSPQESWIHYAFLDRVALGYYAVRSGSGPQANDPRDWHLQGSNNRGGQWTTVDSRQNVIFESRGEIKTFPVTNPGEYQMYRLLIEQVNDLENADYIHLSELELQPVAWPLEGYYAWSTDNQLKGWKDKDDDHDGRSNLMEYLFNGDPTNSSDPGDTPDITYSGNTVTFSYPIRSEDPAIQTLLETSTDLSIWNPASTTIESNPDGDYTQIIQSLNHAGDQLYLRLQVNHE